MSQERNEKLFNILDTFSTRLVRLYYLACWETDDQDGMSSFQKYSKHERIPKR